MNINTNDENDEQSTTTSTTAAPTSENDEQTDESTQLSDIIKDPEADSDETVGRELSSDSSDDYVPEYEIDVGRVIVTDQSTGADTVMWKARGTLTNVDMDPVSELSVHLPEAILGVSESLERYSEDI